MLRGGMIWVPHRLAIYLDTYIETTIENPRSLLWLATHIRGGFSVSSVRHRDLTQIHRDTRVCGRGVLDLLRNSAVPLDILSESVLYGSTI